MVCLLYFLYPFCILFSIPFLPLNPSNRTDSNPTPRNPTPTPHLDPPPFFPTLQNLFSVPTFSTSTSGTYGPTPQSPEEPSRGHLGDLPNSSPRLSVKNLSNKIFGYTSSCPPRPLTHVPECDPVHFPLLALRVGRRVPSEVRPSPDSSLLVRPLRGTTLTGLVPPSYVQKRGVGPKYSFRWSDRASDRSRGLRVIPLSGPV